MNLMKCISGDFGSKKYSNNQGIGICDIDKYIKKEKNLMEKKI